MNGQEQIIEQFFAVLKKMCNFAENLDRKITYKLKQTMKIIHISDTHNQHYVLPALPLADLVVHSGDVSMAGSAQEVKDFIDWFGSLECKYKIFIGGNHDFCLEGKDPRRIQQFLPDNTHYLYNSGVTIEGLRFWGIPYFMSSDFCIENYRQALMEIPDDIDVLITHRPPLEILDRSGYGNMGCSDLLDAVRRISPRYHLFGHIHDAYGKTSVDNTVFVNGAILNDKYEFENDPVIIKM